MVKTKTWVSLIFPQSKFSWGKVLCNRPGVLKLRPAGWIRPAELLNPARETLLFFLFFLSLSLSLFNHLDVTIFEILSNSACVSYKIVIHLLYKMLPKLGSNYTSEH